MDDRAASDGIDDLICLSPSAANIRPVIEQHVYVAK